jgi:hypothetical protein
MTVLVRVNSSLPNRKSELWVNRQSWLGERNMVMGPARPKTKNDSVGKDQQQYTQNRSQSWFGTFGWWLAMSMEAEESAMLEVTT